MADLRQRLACLLCVVVATLAWPAFASEQAFPFARELMLDVAPMRGSKRVPIIEIADNGAAVIQLWCAHRQGFDHHHCRPGSAGAVRAGAANPRRRFARGAGPGHELAPARRCHRVHWRDNAALPPDDQLIGPCPDRAPRDSGSRSRRPIVPRLVLHVTRATAP